MSGPEGAGTPDRVPFTLRPTADLIVAFLAGIVGVVVVTAMVGGIVWKARDPNADIEGVMTRVAGLTNTMVGAVVGYLAGKSTGTEAEPQPHRPPRSAT